MHISDIELFNWTTIEFQQMCRSVNTQEVVLLDYDWMNRPRRGL